MMSLTRDGQGHLVHGGRLLPLVAVRVGYIEMCDAWAAQVYWGLAEDEPLTPGLSVYRRQWQWVLATSEGLYDSPLWHRIGRGFRVVRRLARTLKD